MKLGEDREASRRFPETVGRLGRELARGRSLSPKGIPAFRALAARLPWRTLLVLVGFLVQVVLTVLVYQLVDLSITLMEVWAELARKHLELTLS
jgi:hypothetical protein